SRRSEYRKSFSLFSMARTRSDNSLFRLQKAEPPTTPPYSKGFFIAPAPLRKMRNATCVILLQFAARSDSLILLIIGSLLGAATRIPAGAAVTRTAPEH